MPLMRTLCAALLAVVAVTAAPAPARAVDAVLYEVTEAVRLGKGGSFKSSKATLAGVAVPGSVVCPAWLATQLGIDRCSISVNAVGRADDATGVGPVTGTFDVLMQDMNNVDAPEIVIMRGHLNGTIDLSPAFLANKPRGTVSGDFTASGVVDTALAGQHARGRFDGVFRLPFRVNGRPSYLMDDGSTTSVEPWEYMLGAAMVRIDLTFTEAGATTKKTAR